MQELHAKPLLQRRDGAADEGLAGAESARCGGEAAVIQHSLEHAHLD